MTDSSVGIQQTSPQILSHSTSSHSSTPSADEIVEVLLEHHAKADADLVRRAWEYASVAHAGQMRLSGDPYLNHPANVALTLAKLGMDEHAIAAGLLHDTVEDTESSLEELDAEFSEQVADLVDGVTKISLMDFDTKQEAQAENIRKMILASSHDIRVPIVKLADRLHNMSTLKFQKPAKQLSIAQETMDIYAPLANRFGLHLIKQQLEDLSFHYLKPDVYAHITHWLDENQVVERQLISKVIGHLENMMQENGIPGRVMGRIKQIYSIYKKMQEQNTALDEMHDIIAFRVIVEKNVSDCYSMLGYVHERWKPIPGRIKDYISMPKANNYQSLHTTVIGPEGERIEIQIRTEAMNLVAENGVAAHWQYKERDHAITPQDINQLQWMRDILERQKDEADSRDFLQQLRLDLFSDEIYVSTPKGEIKPLPKGAMPLDFAFMIHTDVGSRTVGAKINGRLQPLSTELKNGDMVEIIIDKNRQPNRDWLKLVKTAKARNRIQYYLRTEEKAAAISLGKEMLEKEGRRMNLNVSKAAKSGRLQLVMPEFNVNSLDDLYASVGYARVTSKKVLHRLEAILHPKEEKPPPEPVAKDEPTRRTDGITIKSMGDTLIHFARCCNPVPGDQVVGFISRGRGVIIHTLDCSNVRELEPERLISVNWDNQEESTPFPSRIRIRGQNGKGLLGRIASKFAEQDINIISGNFITTVDDRADLDFTVEVRDAVHLYQTIEIIRKLSGVLEVTRSTSGNDEE